MNGYIKRSMQLTMLGIGWLVLSFTAHAASFDCAKAGTKIEKMICGDAELSKLDEEMNTAYKIALQNEKKVDAIRQAQKQWLKKRNGCTDAACVSQAYEARLLSLAATHASSDGEAATKQVAKDNPQEVQQYYFQLTKGAGTPVCDAYLERLNTTKYEKPPYCDRPENDSIKGFAKLNRVSLSPNDVHDLYPIILTFVGMANNKNLDWSDLKFQYQLTQTGQFKLSEEGMKNLQMDLDAGWAKMWRYDPPIDIDNDGVLDNVEVWHGLPLDGVGGTQCGEHMLRFPNDPPLRQPQVAFVVTGNNDRLDVTRTEKIFAHPKGGYPIKMDGQWTVSNHFRPIGRSMGIFKYQDTYYFDTFFDGWGDFEDKRRTVYTRHKNKEIVNTLAVFLHQDGKTKQVCEYLMTDNGTQNERGTK